MEIHPLLTSVCIFLSIVFIYLHIQHYHRTSNDPDVYHLEHPSADQLTEIIRLRQPIVFTSDVDLSFLRLSELRTQYFGYNMRIESASTADYKKDPVPNTLDALASDGTQLSAHNSEFMNETGLRERCANVDAVFRPCFTCNRIYDIMVSRTQTATRLARTMNCRNFFSATEGAARVTLIAPKYSRYLHPVMDVNTPELEYIADDDPWTPQAKYKTDFDKIHPIVITLEEGQWLFVPSHWWVSFQAVAPTNSALTTIASFQYRTYINNLAILPQFAARWIQDQRVRLILSQVRSHCQTFGQPT